MSATTLVLLGKTGNGKSSTGNSILGRNAFKSFWSFSSVTKECKMESRMWSGDRKLNVIDTPGLFDTNVPKHTIEKEIVKCINLAKDGVHAVLFVASLKNRFTPEEEEAVERLEMLFGPKIISYMVIIFTGGDQLESDGTTLDDFKDDFPPSLQQIIRRCNSRMVVFNNHKSASPMVKEKQITELLEQVDRIGAENGNQPYSNELFGKAQAMSSQLYHIKDRENIYTEQIKQLNEMMEQNRRAMEERMRIAIEEVEKQLESSRRSRDAAEKEGSRKKEEYEKKIRDLEQEISALKPKQTQGNSKGHKGGGCTIL